jgi:hypothetical protein
MAGDMSVRFRFAVCLAVVGLGLGGAGCIERNAEVSHPFYLTFPEDAQDVALWRCTEGPREGCTRDEQMPGPAIFLAGANARYVAMARYPRDEERHVTDLSRTEYYYFARVPEETYGWGLNPETVVGPLSRAEFEAAKARLGLPDLTVGLKNWRPRHEGRS